MTYLPDENVVYIVLHYSATPVERDFTAADIDEMHRARGFKEIGYHFFLRKDGTVEKGRDLDAPGRFEVGAHSKGENSASIGICYEGGVRAAAPNVGFDSRTRAQKVAMEALILSLLDRFPNAIVEGHRDMPGAATQCPGFNARQWWSEVMERRARELLVPNTVQQTVQDADKPVAKSSTIWALLGAGGGTITAVWEKLMEADPQTLLAVSVVLAALIYVFRERLRKARLGKAAKEALGL